VVQATCLFDTINQLQSVPQIWIDCPKPFEEYMVIIIIQHTAIQNHNHSYWHLWKASSQLFAQALAVIHYWSLDGLVSLLPHPSNLACTLPQDNYEPLMSIPLSIV